MGYRSNQIAEIVGLDKNWDHDACRDEEGHFFFFSDPFRGYNKYKHMCI